MFSLFVGLATVDDRTLTVTAPMLWNQLLCDITGARCLDSVLQSAENVFFFFCFVYGFPPLIFLLHVVIVTYMTVEVILFWAVWCVDRAYIKNVIKDNCRVRPFSLVNADENAGKGILVEVFDAESAEYLTNSLQVTHHRFNPSPKSFISRSFYERFGDLSKGYEVSNCSTLVNYYLNGL